MQSTSRIHHPANLIHVQSKRRVLELLLHVPLAEISQVAMLPSADAVGFGESKVAKTNALGRIGGLDAALVILD